MIQEEKIVMRKEAVDKYMESRFGNSYSLGALYTIASMITILILVIFLAIKL